MSNRFAKAIQRAGRRGFRGHPVGTIAYYGPDARRASKVAVGIIVEDGADAELTRWLTDDTDARTDPEIQRAVFELLSDNNVKTVAISKGIIGCPHEEGIDYPAGEVCPECPYWASRDRWTGEVLN
jgi:hypothetical protein